MLGNGEGRGAIQSCKKKKKKKISLEVSQSARAIQLYKKKNLAVTATKRDDHLLLSSLS
jgi:hypothetical protein